MDPHEPGLDERDAADGWLEQLERWLSDARAGALPEPEAMVLASVSEADQPSARTVLLKGLDEGGLVFYTNQRSRKGRELADNPRAALVFPWFAMHRQVLVTGTVEPVGAAASDAYFASRPYGSRISALASRQSEVIPDRAWLEHAAEQARLQHPPEGEVPRPTAWGGLRVVPLTVEFWQGRRDRLHDRLRYRRVGDGATRSDGGWVLERLSP
jgi:pyridoxamine 5'-phosphate oxidase